MTKLSHIPMQIQKWIASLAHLFFLILGLIGISLMYINGNFGLGLTGIGSVPYEDTAEFNTQFNNDLNDIFLYMEYQDVFGADSSIDLSRRMLKMTFGPSETENFSLSSLISYLESMGYQLDYDFNCQKVSEPADGVKSRSGSTATVLPAGSAAHWRMQRSRSWTHCIVITQCITVSSPIHPTCILKSSTRSQIRIRAKQPGLQTPIP